MKNKQNSETRDYTLKVTQTTNFINPKCICALREAKIVSAIMFVVNSPREKERESYKLRSTRGACKWLILPRVDDRPQISSLETQCI